MEKKEIKEKKLTDEEIVKALEHCGSQHHIKGCKDCPMKGIENCYDEPLTDNALDLIHRLQSENERLTKENANAISLNDALYREKNELQKQVDELTKEILHLHKLLNEKRLEEFNFSKKIVAENAELQKQVDELKEELKNLDWYKMWHKKFKTEIDDLILELETYRPTKLNGNGQCKCSNCGSISWTDWFSRYKGQTLCDKCLEELITEEDKQAVKDTAKNILKFAKPFMDIEEFRAACAEVWSVEVE